MYYSSFRESGENSESRGTAKREAKSVRFSDSTSTELNPEQSSKSAREVRPKGKVSPVENRDKQETAHHDGKVHVQSYPSSICIVT